MPNRVITCEPHHVSGATPVIHCEGTALVAVAPNGAKAAADVVPGDVIFTFVGSPQFTVATNAEAPPVPGP